MSLVLAHIFAMANKCKVDYCCLATGFVINHLGLPPPHPKLGGQNLRKHFHLEKLNDKTETDSPFSRNPEIITNASLDLRFLTVRSVEEDSLNSVNRQNLIWMLDTKKSASPSPGEQHPQTKTTWICSSIQND